MKSKPNIIYNDAFLPNNLLKSQIESSTESEKLNCHRNEKKVFEKYPTETIVILKVKKMDIFGA